jgi:transcriptional regulator with XRE-family HTH domain
MEIKKERLKRGLLQKYVAKQLGISQRHYQRFENEGRIPNKEQFTKIAEIFGCNEKLLKGDN